MDGLSTSEREFIEWVKQLGQDKVVSGLDTTDSMEYAITE